MDIDTLILLLIFLGVVISQIRKMVVSSRKKETGKEPGWQKALKQIISRIQEEVNPEIKMSPQKGTSLWGSIIGEEDIAQKDDDQKEVAPPKIIDAELEVLETPEHLIKKEAKLAETYLRIEDNGTKGKDGFDIRELRRAVVWSEILAAPVGLREDW